LKKIKNTKYIIIKKKENYKKDMIN
jgi:hypothetical protein